MVEEYGRRIAAGGAQPGGEPLDGNIHSPNRAADVQEAGGGRLRERGLWPRRGGDTADVTVNRFDEFESYSGQFLDGGKGVGVTAWGMNVLRLPATCAGYTEHDHRADGQEKVYVVLRGSVTLQADGETGSSSRVRWPA